MSALFIKYIPTCAKTPWWRGASNKASQHRKLHAVAKKSVFVSTSRNVFENLALEDWFYQNLDFENQSALFLWVNNPCVVIGRHQNPWLEVNLKNSSIQNVSIARRNSGGGTVYHDSGNLNCTFYTSRAIYNRKRNLDFVCEILKKNWGLNVKVNQREDIMINDVYKISGTASKLGHKNAYHHCTLLVDVNTSNLHEVLEVIDLGIQSKSTASVRSKVLNMKAFSPQITVDDLISHLGHHFQEVSSGNKGDFSFVSPKEEEFPGIAAIQQTLCSWEWIFGKTPSFSLNVESSNLHRLHLGVNRGQIETVSSEDVNHPCVSELARILTKSRIDPKLMTTISENCDCVCSSSHNCIELKKVLRDLCSITV